jgi:hypothetical protein
VDVSWSSTSVSAAALPEPAAFGAVPATFGRPTSPHPHAVELPGPENVPRVLGRHDALAMGFTRSAIEYRLRTKRWHRVLPHT